MYLQTNKEFKSLNHSCALLLLSCRDSAWYWNASMLCRFGLDRKVWKHDPRRIPNSSWWTCVPLVQRQAIGMRSALCQLLLKHAGGIDNHGISTLSAYVQWFGVSLCCWTDVSTKCPFFSDSFAPLFEWFDAMYRFNMFDKLNFQLLLQYVVWCYIVDHMFGHYWLLLLCLLSCTHLTFLMMTIKGCRGGGGTWSTWWGTESWLRHSMTFIEQRILKKIFVLLWECHWRLP